eukprot:c1768_g1_i1 orf=19-234(-)
MSGLMDKVKDVAGKKENNMGQPGDNVERSADNAANSRIDNAATQAGVPQQADDMINKVADNKINSDIPGGN